MRYKNKFGTIRVMSKKKVFRNKTLGLSMSGGADSTLLCYILAKTSYAKNLNITIQPYNGYDLWAPTDSNAVIDIVHYIQRSFPDVDLQWPISTVFNTQGNQNNNKNTYIASLLNRLEKYKVVDLVMNGVSMGPPLEVQQNFIKQEDGLSVKRLPGYHLWHEIERVDDYLAPFKFVNKKFIIECYKQFGIMSLLDITYSCTNLDSNKTTCGVCWWCQERAWALN